MSSALYTRTMNTSSSLSVRSFWTQLLHLSWNSHEACFRPSLSRMSVKKLRYPAARTDLYLPFTQFPSLADNWTCLPCHHHFRLDASEHAILKRRPIFDPYYSSHRRTRSPLNVAKAVFGKSSHSPHKSNIAKVLVYSSRGVL